MDRTLDMTEHDGGRRLKAQPMCGLDNREPLSRGQFVGTDDAPDFIVENFGGGTRQRA